MAKGQIRIPDELHYEFKVAASKARRPMLDCAAEAIQEWLRKQRKQRKQRTPAGEGEGSRVGPGMGRRSKRTGAA